MSPKTKGGMIRKSEAAVNSDIVRAFAGATGKAEIDMAGWQFWMDRGGTFTDIVARTPAGELVTHKLLSENPAHYKDAAIQGIRELLELEDQQPIPTDQIDHVKMGTTVATNALLERKGEPTLLLTSHGLGDVLRIGFQTRPDIFALDIELPEQLYVGVVEAAERMLADGSVDLPLDEEGLKVILKPWRDKGVDSIAIVFAHSYLFPDHEKAAARIANELGFKQISLSHEVSPLIKMVPRGDTTVVDAYLSPVLRRYVDQVAGQLESTGSETERTEQSLAARGEYIPVPSASASMQTTASGKDSVYSAMNSESDADDVAFISIPGSAADGAGNEPVRPSIAGMQSSSVHGRIHSVSEQALSSGSASEESLVKNSVPLYFMQSNGGLVDAHQFRGKDAILSGPAGGVVGMVESAREDGFERIIGFDMGGTSTDVAHFNAGQFSDEAQQGVRQYEREFETQVAGVRLRAPMMNIHTVAAGGGSIIKFADGRFQVGPESAGAYPGPKCYRNGGPLSVTDCNVLLGKVKADYFPECFGPERNQPLDFDGVQLAFEELALEINQQLKLTGEQAYSAYSVAQGFLDIAIENMANAVKKISLQRGYDVSEYVLNAFGGAGAQHACLVADSLGMQQVYLHPMAGVLSAYGIGLANQRWLGEESLQLEYNSGISLCGLQDQVELRQIRLQDSAEANTTTNKDTQAKATEKSQDFWRIHVKYQGTDTPLLLTLPNNLDLQKLADEFHQLHQQTFGFSDPDRTLVFEALQLERVSGGRTPDNLIAEAQQKEEAAQVIAKTEMVCNGEVYSAPVYRREELTLATKIVGPALIAENNSTIVIEPGWSCEMIASGALLLNRKLESSVETSAEAERTQQTLAERGEYIPVPSGPASMQATSSELDSVHSATDDEFALNGVADKEAEGSFASSIGDELVRPSIAGPQSSSVQGRIHSESQQALANAGISKKPVERKPNAVQLEIFNNLFMFVAEQMGFVLEKTAASVNIKERLDFSCALFDKQGDLVANAPHIPVHLGSMSESIKVVIRDNQNMKNGDAFVLNTPYNGGTHLPDITIVKPVFISGGVNADFYVAARGHHADIGGITPGSMPARSQHIEEEGILLDNLKLVDCGEFQETMIRDVLANSSKYPARNIDQNIADLKAQLAACEKGSSELKRLSKQYGLQTLHDYMRHVQDNAETTLRNCLAQLNSGEFEYAMDDGSKIKVAITVDQQARTAVVDFAGTSDQHAGNFNAPSSVGMAAVLYVFRCLVAKPMPLNAGFFRALDIRIPAGSMLAPQYPAAVVSGNVETAQYVVDTLMGALGLMAGCQGTNNNFTFGDEEHQYYETICGGAGATGNANGASGVHSHMTNSRLTDPEVLEQRFPVMLERFAIRPDSGGAGEHRGGDGVERHIRFLKPMAATIISGHRDVPTFSLAGGDPGKTGFNFVKRWHIPTGREHEQIQPKLEFLSGCTDIRMNSGDVFCIHTPGGGGYGLKGQGQGKS